MGDPAIKLFGKTIPLMETGSGLSSDRDRDPIAELAGEYKDVAGETTNNEVNHTDPDVPIDMEQEEENSPSSVNNPNENEQQISSQDVIEKSDSKPEQDQSETDASGEEKVLKKPDKILPCPRCNSLDTKFCYYNNYNVNQPRHFCKNCQRYWTAGGTMRNVPVGAGRRKHKNSASPHYRHIMMSHEPLATSTREAAAATDSTTHHHVVSMRSVNGNNGTVLKFGPEAPLCESMSSVLNLGEQKKKRESSTEEPSCASSVTASNCAENGFPEQNGIQGYSNGPTPMHPMHYFPGPPWAYPWGPGWNNVAAASATAIVNGSEVGAMSSIQWSPPPILAAPAFCAPPIPVPFMPASFWPAGAWNVPWAGPSGCLSPSSSTSNSGCSGNGGSPTLGKHSRDVTSLQGEEKTGKSLWVPKTLRIDEAAKSSIWATLGIKPDDGGMFKAFQFKGQRKGQRTDSPQLYANPAALSRSQSFQESA